MLPLHVPPTLSLIQMPTVSQTKFQRWSLLPQCLPVCWFCRDWLSGHIQVSLIAHADTHTKSSRKVNWLLDVDTNEASQNSLYAYMYRKSNKEGTL